MTQKWYSQAWRRNVVDTHIEDWDKSFLSKVDPKQYVRMLKKAGVDSTVLYAHSHVGYCNYPTKVGHMHKGLNGRDVFGEISKLCHKSKIKVVAYYSLIFNNWAYDNNPGWRMIRADGTEATAPVAGSGKKKGSRYGVCCVNSPYRDYIKKEIAEICTGYDFAGIRFDMTFWPMVCYCEYCRSRYAQEVGGELPTVINWRDPKWVAFQRCRERWLIELAEIATGTARALKPGVSVEHQSSTYALAWQWGVTTGLSKQCDFLQGDFYGGELQASFACKQLYNMTENQPFGYETSVTHHLGNTYKTKELLRAQAYNAIANGGAFIFIDSIDPVGTLNEKVYTTMGEIFEETKAYDEYLGGELCQDVGIYLSTESKFYMTDKTAAADKVSTNAVHDLLPHTENVVNAVHACIENNIPYGVITKHNLKDLHKFKAVVLANVSMMDDEEADALRAYVAGGGCLYGSKYTSLFMKHDGSMKNGNFLLGDVFGIKHKGETAEAMTFIAPSKAGQKLLSDFSEKYPMAIAGSQLVVEAAKGAVVLGTTILPYTDPADPSRFASIHCNPPGIATGNPAVICNKYGRGRAIYVSTDLENQECQRDAFMTLLKSIIKTPMTFESDAPAPVEVICFEQKAQKRYIVNVLNFQKIVPALPVENVRVVLRTGDKKIKRVAMAPNNKKIAFKNRTGEIEFVVARVEAFNMVTVQY